MNLFFKEKKIRGQAGMTYIELIVVLSIFSIISAITLFNYKKFQARVDIKNLANDIALKVVEAQKSALSGALPTTLSLSPTWKPSYGIYFDGNVNLTKFYYFTDLQDGSGVQNKELDPPYNNCPAQECLQEISITRGDFISKIESYTSGNSVGNPVGDKGLSITFTRPNSGATFKPRTEAELTGIEYIQITISSQDGTMSNIKVYPSGRIQIN